MDIRPDYTGHLTLEDIEQEKQLLDQRLVLIEMIESYRMDFARLHKVDILDVSASIVPDTDNPNSVTVQFKVR